jgi:capsule polysaccharide export protein KpsE/RkpR
MSEQQDSPIPGSRADDNPPVNAIVLATAIATHKLLILCVTVAVALISTVILLIVPNVYQGTARIVPSDQPQVNVAMAMVGQLAGAIPGVPGLGGSGGADMVAGVLKSRTIADRLIQQFNLVKVYDADNMVEAREELVSHTLITVGVDGIVIVDFFDESPARAADVANAYVLELERLTNDLEITSAQRRRGYYERQLLKAKEGLVTAEQEFRKTQESTGLIKLDDQGRVIIESIATLKGQIAAKEVQLGSLRLLATEQNPEYLRAKAELDGLIVQLRNTESGGGLGGTSVIVPTGKVPEAGMEYIRKYREVKYFETLYEAVAKQFEVAKLEEAKDFISIQVLDNAVAPDKEAKPKRVLIIGLCTVTAFLLAILWVIFQEWFLALRRDPAERKRMDALYEQCRTGWTLRVRR